VWTQTVAAAQYNSVAFEAWVNVHVGDSLNFTINGAPPTGFSEGIGFQAQIFSCTNSSSGGSGGAGGTLGATGGSGGASGNVAQGGTAPVGGASAALGGMVSTPGAWQTVGQACSDSPPWTTDASPAVQLTVDAAQRGQTWNRFYERVVAADHANTVLSSAWGRNIQGALQKAHDQAGFQSVRFHGILDSDIGVYTEVNGSPVYAWTRFDQVYDAIVAAGMWPFVEISFTPPPLASDPSKTLNWYNGAPANISPPKDWNRWMDFMAAIVQHVEQRYGVDEVRNNWRFEIWNEASWMYSLGTAGYNELYSYTVRGLTRGDDQIKVGGPAESGGGSASSISSLISYARTNNLKLDFATYHYYAQDPSGNVALSTASAFFQGTMLSTVQTAKFTGELFATEWGPAYSTVVAQDTEIGASFIAKTIHLIGTSATVAPPSGYAYWTVSDIYEEFDTGKSLAYRNGNYGLLLKGDPNIPESFDVAKPAFNAFRILHMMGDVNLATSGGTQGDGVNAAATLASSDNSIRILVYNHADGGNANSALSSSVSVTVNNLPFGPGPVRMRQYVVDKTHSNSYNTWCQIGMPPQPDQSQWVQLRNDAELCYYETSLTPTNNSFSVTFPQNNYSVALMVLSQ
jgi:xylan 1,4-beta-xylosidase